jgi:phenylacetate-CoA ligase
MVYGFYNQLLHSQWIELALLRSLQSIQLAARLNHAARHSSYFRPLLGKDAILPEDAFSVLQSLPVLTRTDLQERAGTLVCELGKEHGAVTEKRTTGSTGQPVAVQCSATAFALRGALTIRNYRWSSVALEKSFAAIRSGLAPGKAEGVTNQSWGGAMARLFATGPSFGLGLDQPLPVQANWLRQHKPAYLLTYPSNLRVLLDVMPSPWDGLLSVMCIGESVPAELRAVLRSRWGVPLFDQYSSEELGSIAAQCGHGSYHTMAESLHVEVLRDDGTSCQPGEIGRVVVTDLYNFATTMLRYELRDYAEVGWPCACGRKLPVLKRIVGRTRNRLTLPDGSKIWPSSGLRHFDQIPIRQFQLIQLSLEKLELRMQVARALTDSEEKAIREQVLKTIGYPFQLDLLLYDCDLPKGPSGKFEQFISLVG